MALSLSHERVVAVDGLGKRYPGEKADALNGVSFHVARGEIFGLLGPNGAGKTTAMSILSGLMRPARGTVRILGESPFKRSLRVKRAMGLVPQEIALYPSLTVVLSDHARRRVSTLSGGMKRRANLGIALLHQPQVMILDEPTVGVDVETRKIILDRLEAFSRDGMTLIYASHYMEEVQRLCTRAAILDRGEILVQGPLAHIMSGIPDCQNLEEAFLSLTGRRLIG
ncbi:MAG: ATP-binding cassette domain-containing protein [Deltaproteobacteria bacterium]